MEWTPEHIYLLRKHLGETQAEFAARLGLRRRVTITEWETGKVTTTPPMHKLLDIIASDAGFTERVAARLRKKLARGE